MMQEASLHHIVCGTSKTSIENGFAKSTLGTPHPEHPWLTATDIRAYRIVSHENGRTFPANAFVVFVDYRGG